MLSHTQKNPPNDQLKRPQVVERAEKELKNVSWKVRGVIITMKKICLI